MIQVFVEALDRCFENVCELDLIFHSDKVLYILDEIVMGGLVLETNLPEIIASIEEQNKLERCAFSPPQSLHAHVGTLCTACLRGHRAPCTLSRLASPFCTRARACAHTATHTCAQHVALARVSWLCTETPRREDNPFAQISKAIENIRR